MEVMEAGGTTLQALPTATGERVVLVAAGGELFGLPLAGCREVVPPRAVTPLPGSAAWVLGLVNLRGRLVTVVDLGLWLGIAASGAAAGHGIVMVEHAGRRIGVAVEDVVHIIPLPAGGSSASDRGIRILPLDSAALPEDAGITADVVSCLELDVLFDAVLS